MHGNDLAQALAQAAQQIAVPTDLEGTLEMIVKTAEQSLPDIDHVGVSIVHRKGRIETRAASSDMVLRFDELQYELDEGPCLDAIRPGASPVMRVENARHEQRWPRYIPRAVELGLRAQLGLRLYVDDKALGGLNMYSTTSDTIGEETEIFAELFAQHAAVALGHARREDTLSSAIATRQLIGQATGIVMERYHLTQDRAFEYLARVSSTSNVKLRDLAEELVRESEKRADDA